MPTSDIKSLLSYPNNTPIEALQARIAQVYELRNHTGQYDPTTIQNIVLEDATGTIRCSVWGHPDLKDHQGKEYVFGGGRKGNGLMVKHGTGQYAGKVELTMKASGTLQHVEVYHANKPANAVSEPAKGSNQAPVGKVIGYAGQGAPSPINGAKVGMALNNAVLMLNASGLPYGIADIRTRAVEIIQLSNDLESGRTPIDAPAEASRPKPAQPTPEEKAANLVDKKGNPAADEDVPY